MADRVAEFLISLGADDGDLRSMMAGVKSRFKSDVAELERTTKNADLFAAITDNLPKVQAAMDKAKAAVVDLNKQIEKAKEAGKPYQDLQAQLSAAERSLSTATREFARQNTEVNALQARLKSAGVDTSNLAKEQQRLAAAVVQANQAASQQAAKDLLGFKSLADVTPKVEALRQAFDTLKASGKLSAEEIAAAQTQLNTKIKELQQSVTTTGGFFATAGKSAQAFFDSAIGQALSATAVLATLRTAMADVVAETKRYQQALAEIATVTNLSNTEIGALGQSARDLARTMGVDVIDAVQSVRDLLRSGVSDANVIDVLRESAIASKAGLTDLKVAVEAADILIDGFGVKVQDLRKYFDVIVQGSKDGGLTLQEFAQNTSGLLNVARASGVEFNVMYAALTKLRDGGLGASEATQLLSRVIVGLNTTEAQQKLLALGLEGQNLITVFQTLSERGIPLEQLLQLGVVSKKATEGMATLTNAAPAMAAELDRLNASAGVAAEAMKRFLESPAARSAAFSAAIKEAELNLGQLIGTGSLLGQIGTQNINILNDWANGFRMWEKYVSGANVTFGDVRRAFLGLPAETEPARQAIETFRGSAKDLQEQLDRGIKSMDTYSASLLSLVDAVAQSAKRNIADINSLAEAQIAAIGDGAKRSSAAMDRLLEVEKKRRADLLATIEENEKKITAATEKAIAARVEVLRKAGATVEQIEANVANIRLKYASEILNQYRTFWDQQVSLAQKYEGQIQEILNSRVAFTERVESTISEIRLRGLSDWDKYLVKVQEIDKAISAEREAAANGDIRSAEKYANQAIDLAKTLQVTYTQSGAKIVTELQAQQQSIEKITTASDILKDAYGEAATTAEKGFIQAQTAANGAAGKIEELTKSYNALKAAADAGVTVQMNIDAASLSRVWAEIEKLKQGVTVPVRYVAAESMPTGGGATGGFNRGGYVARDTVRRFAAGGGVWRVPGSGDRDTVPALLREGSFVLRKSASQHFGSDLLGSLAGVQKFAFGGLAERYLGTGTESPDAASWRTTRRDSDATITDLIASATGLPPASWGDDIRAYLARVLEMIRMARSSGEAKAIWDRFKIDVDSIRVAIAQSHQMNAPLVYWGGSLSGPAVVDDPKRPVLSEFYKYYGSSSAWQNLQNSSNPWASKPMGTFRFAGGGSVATDTVPALLTPGEFVINPSAVRAIGPDLLQAMNSLQITKQAFAGLRLEPPRRPLRFASGGYVPGAPAAASIGSRAIGGVTINITATGADFRDESAVRRLLLPVIRDIQRRTG